MGTVYAFFADGFEEIEAFTTIDILRRAGLNVKIVSVTPDEIVVGAHDVSVFCDINFVNCDFFDAELLFLPGGMPGAATLDKHEGLRKLILDFAAKGCFIEIDPSFAYEIIEGIVGVLPPQKVLTLTQEGTQILEKLCELQKSLEPLKNVGGNLNRMNTLITLCNKWLDALDLRISGV